jgi:hypothetical protein
MTEQELRALVREAIGRATSGDRAGQVLFDQPAPGPRPAAVQAAIFRQTASHGLFAVPAGADGDGPCVIEPAVACNHCGYCKSYGH